MKKGVFLFFILSVLIVAQNKSFKTHDQQNAVEQPVKNFLRSVSSYGSPQFNNQFYTFNPLVTAPANVNYTQAGLSTDGSKIVAQKYYDDGPIRRVEIVLMNSDGSGETIISAGNSDYNNGPTYGNPFWSDDGLYIGYVERNVSTNNRVLKYELASGITTAVYEPTGSDDVANPDFLGSSTTSIIFWDYGAGGGADLFIWDGTTRTNITNTSNYKEYEPISNEDGTVILYWSGETTAEPINTTHTLTFNGSSWVKDLGFTPIVDSYWGYWTGRDNQYIAVTVMSTKDIHLYDNAGNFLMDLTGAQYNGSSGQWNFVGSHFQGPNGEIIMTSNAGRTTSGRDIIKATPYIPVPTLPANLSVLTLQTIYFSWYTTKYGMKFDLEIDDNMDFSSPITIAADLTGTFHSYDASSLIPGQPYKWRITGKTNTGIVISYSDIWQFTTQAVPAPVATYPTNGVMVYTQSPTIYWYINSYYPGLYYRVRYGTSSGSYTETSSVTSNLYLTLSSLTPGNTYYYVVDASTSNTFSTNVVTSSEESFEIFSSPPLTPPIPVPSWPVSGNDSYINPPTLYWYITTYIDGLKYFVEWDDDSNLDDTPMGNSGWIENLYFMLPSALNGGTYYWRVRSKIGDGGTPSSWSTVESFNIPSFASTGAPVPTQTYPVGGTIVYTLSPTLYWYASSAYTLNYDLRYSTSLDGGGQLFNPTTVTDLNNNFYILSGLSAGTTYYWQVRAKVAGSPGSESPWSSIATFTTDAGAFAVVPLIGSPNHAQPISSSSVVLSWVVPTKSDSKLTYEVEYTHDANFEYKNIIGGLDKPFVEINGLYPDNTYYWRVISKTEEGKVSDYSSIGIFKTVSNVTAVEENDVINYNFELYQNYPNPFNPETSISFSIGKKDHVMLTIYDILGKEVKRLISEELSPGRYNLVWYGDDNYGNKVASGVYFYKLISGSNQAVKRMLLIK
ncbi:fibronectin type III domain-containing protein [Melioribacter sp. OK-6-Me]|uniref:fibronectin type III domain-containing protein n=1 Tax=unclassified Melioribacter TaxID=2627329 RepID=UPI003ED8EE49